MECNRTDLVESSKEKVLTIFLNFCLFILFFGIAKNIYGQSAENGAGDIAETPPMGWNSWNHFKCNINENIIKETTDAIVASGMKDAGYEYIVIDDCWMADHRNSEGKLIADPKRFPHGIKWLADYVHRKGLKLGIYSSAGTKTCQGLPASLDHEEADAQIFAKWGVDYLKYDNCYNQGRPQKERYSAMHDALASAGRPIFYSICDWGYTNPWEWATNVGNMWRTSPDIRDNWENMITIIDQQVGLYEYAGPGHWNDPDMLEVGNGGMTTREYQTHFSMWAIMAAPLMAGNDLRNMSDKTLKILTNKEVVAVDQDPAGKQGYKLTDNGDQEVWVKEMADGSRIVAFLNRGKNAAFMTTSAKKIGLPKADQYKVHNLWEPEKSFYENLLRHKDAVSDNLLRARIPSHGVGMFRVRTDE